MQDGMALRLLYLKSNRSNFKANSVANWKPMQIRKNRCVVTEQRYLCDPLEQEYSGHAEGLK